VLLTARRHRRQIQSIAVAVRRTVRGVMNPEIMAYYQSGIERDRLAFGARRIEFLRMWDLLGRHLPPQPSQVLDGLPGHRHPTGQHYSRERPGSPLCR
jgi:hypothetical protein